MNVNVDQIIERATGWQLTVTIHGKSIAIHRPQDAAMIALAGKLKSGATDAAATAILREAISALVDEPADVATWTPTQLVAVLNSVFEEARRTKVNDMPKFGEAIRKGIRSAMRPEAPVLANNSDSGRSGSPAAPFSHEPVGGETRQAVASL
jgi:hypothetical protein